MCSSQGYVRGKEKNNLQWIKGQPQTGSAVRVVSFNAYLVNEPQTSAVQPQLCKHTRFQTLSFPLAEGGMCDVCTAPTQSCDPQAATCRGCRSGAGAICSRVLSAPSVAGPVSLSPWAPTRFSLKITWKTKAFFGCYSIFICFFAF